MSDTINIHTFDRLLNIHQSVKLAQVVNINKELLNAQIRQNQKLNALNNELTVANNLNRQMLQNQIAELRRQEEQVFYKSLAFNSYEIIEKLETIDNLNLKAYFLQTYSEKLKTNLEKAKNIVEELTDKSQIKTYIGQLSNISNTIINSADFLNSELGQLNDAISEYKQLEIQIDNELKKLKTQIREFNIPSPGLFGLNNKARQNALNERTELENIFNEKLNKKQSILNNHKSKILYNKVVLAFPEFETFLDTINKIEKNFNDRFDSKPQNKLNPIIIKAAQLIVERQQCSTLLLQRHIKIGVNRAEKIVSQLEELGIVSLSDGTPNRKVLVKSLEEMNNKFSKN